MSFHPESYRGFVEDEVCPYCKSHDIQYLDKIDDEFGTSAFFQVDECECFECGKKFAMVSFVETTPYGTIPMEEYRPDRVSNYSRKPTVKKKTVKKAAKPKTAVKKKTFKSKPAKKKSTVSKPKRKRT